MTTETIKTRSMKAAQAIVAERGLTPEQFGIIKMGKARYDLTIEITDEPAKPAKAPKPQTIDRHWNDDGSLTVYEGGRKVRRFGGEDNEEASEAEMDDTEGFVETWLNRRHPKRAGGWVYGRTTHGHNWHTKKAKRLRAQILELSAAGKDTTALAAELAKIGGRKA